MGELYPAPAFAQMCVDAGAAFSLSSDAHLPEHVGWEYAAAVEAMRGWGIDEVAVFDGRDAAAGAVGLRVGARIGIGYDAHRFAEGRRLVLGGVEIPSERGLEGHSDADVVTHAVLDAVLGAAGLGDLGTHFPPTDERWRDADSFDLLRVVARPASRHRRQRRRDGRLRAAPPRPTTAWRWSGCWARR